MREIGRQIVIDCSRLDREFAERLSVSLQARHVSTFLHHMDAPIRFTPKLIEPSSGSASHLLCVVSANSVTDDWLRRNLSAAAANGSVNARIVPVLIDEVEMPATARRLCCVDFRNWQHVDAYYQIGLSQLLRAIRIAPSSLIGFDIEWFVAYSAPLRRIQSALQFLAGQIFMGLASRSGAHYMAVKWAIDDDDLPDLLRYLSSIIPSASRSTRLPVLAAAVVEALEYVDVHVSHRSDYREEERADRLWRLLDVVAHALDELRADVELALTSSPRYAAPQAAR
jgi:hypothetical protein